MFFKNNLFKIKDMEFYTDEQLRTFKNEKLVEIINVYGDKTEFLKLEADKAIVAFEKTYETYGRCLLVLDERMNGKKEL
jgi:hypothetical protein